MKLGLFINNKSEENRGGTPQLLVNPATEETFAEVSGAAIKDCERAVNGAETAYRQTWRNLAPGKRAEILFAIAREIRLRLEELAQLETQNIGKPISDARDEIGLGARVFEYYAGAVGKFYGQTIPVARGGFDFTLREPLGVVAAIVPWNFPFPITCWKVAPALAAGNTVILKPASLSPVTALKLGEICAQAGLPEGVLQIVPGSGKSIGDFLVQHPLIRKISFTGSTEIGVRIMEQGAKTLKRISLELGGKSPNIIFADADIQKAAASAPMSVFANTGQDCCARSRVFVEEKVFDSFVEKFLEATKKLVVADPTDSKTELGPLVSKGQREAVEDFLKGLDSTRHKVLCGGDRPGSKGFFLNPALVMGCETGDRIWNEEVFGPVVCIRSFRDEKQLVEEINASSYGLSGSIWTSDLFRALRMARSVESGVLSINSHSSVHVEAPFGGYKMSGIGRDLGMTAMEGYTELKNVYISDL